MSLGPPESRTAHSDMRRPNFHPPGYHNPAMHPGDGMKAEDVDTQICPKLGQLKSLLFEVPGEEASLSVAGRAVVYLGLLVWGWRFILAPIKSNIAGQSFIHLVNLPFHEAGHVLFGPFGRFIGVLGGSLMQLVIPAVVLCAFIYHRNVFGGAVGLWWLGESFLDLAPYIDDARAGQLLLLGGVTGSEVEDYHDWEAILRQLGWLQYDHSIARLAHSTGTALILLSLAWGGYVLCRQFVGRSRGMK